MLKPFVISNQRIHATLSFIFLALIFDSLIILHAKDLELNLVFRSQLIKLKENKDGIFLSHDNCFDKKPCLALKKINSLPSIGDIKKIINSVKRSADSGPGSLGDETCKHVFKARSVLAKKTNGDMRSLCVFSDNSIIESNSLTNFLNKK